MKTKAFTLRLPLDLYVRLATDASDRKMSLNALVRWRLQHSLKQDMIIEASKMAPLPPERVAEIMRRLNGRDVDGKV